MIFQGNQRFPLTGVRFMENGSLGGSMERQVPIPPISSFPRNKQKFPSRQNEQIFAVQSMGFRYEVFRFILSSSSWFTIQASQSR